MLGERLQQIPGITPEISVQKSTILGTAKILCRTFRAPKSLVEELDGKKKRSQRGYRQVGIFFLILITNLNIYIHIHLYSAAQLFKLVAWWYFLGQHIDIYRNCVSRQLLLVCFLRLCGKNLVQTAAFLWKQTRTLSFQFIINYPAFMHHEFSFTSDRLLCTGKVIWL